jgi:regulator of sirC expression with transglutaminase-like and TPR domain
MWQERGIVKYANLKDLLGALRDFDKVVKLDASNVMSYVFRGFVRRDLGQKEGAIADFRRSSFLAVSQNNRELTALMQENLRNLGVNQ